MWTFPTVANFKAQFVRDFNYAPVSDATNLDYVTDADIQNGLNQAVANFNPTLAFANDAARTLAALYCAAFFMVSALQTSAQGVGSQSNFPITSRSVAGVSVSYQVPEPYLKNAALAIYTANGYGLTYLSYTLNLLVGHVYTVEGTTTID